MQMELNKDQTESLAYLRNRVDALHDTVFSLDKNTKMCLLHLELDCADLSLFFPARDNASLLKFMDHHSPHYSQRRKAFLNLMRINASNDRKILALSLIHI